MRNRVEKFSVGLESGLGEIFSSKGNHIGGGKGEKWEQKYGQASLILTSVVDYF